MQAKKPAIPSTSSPSRPKPPWFTRWLFWALVTMVISGGVGFGATLMLVKPFGHAHCSLTRWSLASASMRLYCAQSVASQQTLEGVLEGIALVEVLPEDHPMRGEADRYVEDWAEMILQIADEAFHAGELETAIEAAQQVPNHTPSFQRVQQQIQDWQATWTKAAQIYAQAEIQIRQENWRQASQLAMGLPSAGNVYWETTKYEELNNQIFLARQDTNRLAKARRLGEQGDLESLSQAIGLVQSISQQSLFHQQAQTEFLGLSQELLDLAETSMENQDYEGALMAVWEIPITAGLERQIQDFIDLALPRSWTWEGTIPGLKRAIAEAKQMGPERPLYGQARGLIRRWEREITALEQLQLARQEADPGTIPALRQAIATASTVSRSNPRWQEVNAVVEAWQAEVEAIEDQPYLNQAVQQAKPGSIPALKAAIQTARAIPPDRSLYPEAQDAIASWQADIDAQEFLTQATDLVGSSSNPISLGVAIRIANQVAPTSTFRSQADEQIYRWSQMILNQAQELAATDLGAAVQLIRQIPKESTLYPEAQQQLTQWGQEQNPDQTIQESNEAGSSEAPTSPKPPTLPGTEEI